MSLQFQNTRSSSYCSSCRFDNLRVTYYAINHALSSRLLIMPFIVRDDSWTPKRGNNSTTAWAPCMNMLN